MDFWLSFLPIVIYLLLIALLVIGIILGIKTIITMDLFKEIVENVNTKLDSLDPIFELVESTGEKINGLSGWVTNLFGGLLNMVFKSKAKKEARYEEL